MEVLRRPNFCLQPGFLSGVPTVSPAACSHLLKAEAGVLTSLSTPELPPPSPARSSKSCPAFHELKPRLAIIWTPPSFPSHPPEDPLGKSCGLTSEHIQNLTTSHHRHCHHQVPPPLLSQTTRTSCFSVWCPVTKHHSVVPPLTELVSLLNK